MRGRAILLPYLPRLLADVFNCKGSSIYLYLVSSFSFYCRSSCGTPIMNDPSCLLSSTPNHRFNEKADWLQLSVGTVFSSVVCWRADPTITPRTNGQHLNLLRADSSVHWACLRTCWNAFVPTEQHTGFPPLGFLLSHQTKDGKMCFSQMVTPTSIGNAIDGRQESKT